ncbi:helix-turn-helix domain-containing protein [Candidatus Microgenomates bacterium]|nr:MAG: helix-turn-helix domain-containing protein [Candidatus Microgenomates bacterium]
MKDLIVESKFPIEFRKEDAQELGKLLREQHNVVLIGMKRVGINNFLRFFLNHDGIVDTYISDDKKHLFIPVDLNDLVELEIFPFWTLTLKRIIDAAEKSSMDEKVKKDLEALFLHSIQSQDLFLTIDSVRKSLVKIVENNILPTLFFLRFDRIKDVVTPGYFANLQGLRDATHRKLTCVFTSFRELDVLSSSVFNKTSMPVFARNIYIKPAKKEDAKIVFETYKSRYKINFSPEKEKDFFELVDGYVQYLHLSLIIITEKNITENLFEELIKDERIALQSEELWENLTKEEQNVLLKTVHEEGLMPEEFKKAKYLWDTGIIKENKIFSPLFEYYLKQKEKAVPSENFEFTKKEKILFNFLQKNINQICEREEIVNNIWPEVEAMGVSDWAIDRLVARVRSKLKSQKSNFEIQTVKTRGFKLIPSQ